VSFWQDYIAGCFPQFSKELFVTDLVYSVVSKNNSQKISRVRVTPAFFDHDIFILFKKTLADAIELEVIRDESVSVDNIIEFDFEVSEDYLNFQNYLVLLGETCTEEEFRIIKLSELYRKYINV
jgi:hypothetical protein